MYIIMCVYIHILYCYIATLLSCILRTFPVMLEEMRKEDQRVKYLWEVLEKFSNEDRSRFLRFVTGRRRLPAIMHVVGESVPDFFLPCVVVFIHVQIRRSLHFPAMGLFHRQLCGVM